MGQYQPIPGNFYDKYQSKNPVERFLVEGFLRRVDTWARESGHRELLDVGSGEGVIARRCAAQGFQVHAIDVEPAAVAQLKESESENLSVELLSIYELAQLDRSWPLVLCLEVLEHLEDPEQALKALQAVSGDRLILSVPQEPLWRLLNIVRGAYWREFGNTPGHIQHWSSAEFVKLVSSYFEVLRVSRQLPWTMLEVCVRR